MPGEGSVYQSGGRWVAQISTGPRGGRTLQRRYAPWHDNTKARARILLADLLAERRAELQVTQLWPRIGESEVEFKRRRNASKNAESYRNDRDGKKMGAAS